MSDWRKRAQIIADVVYFPRVHEEKALRAEEVFLWDLDKTYLDTKFETIKGLLKTATEKAFQKKNVPGTKALVHSLQETVKAKTSIVELPIYFITASPPQMEDKILQKLNLDQIYPYGLFCKDNLQNLKPTRLWMLTQQVGYKLQALMQLRKTLCEDVRMIMFGDDSESDAVIYSLFSDVCARRLDSEEIRLILKNFRVVGSQVDTIMRLQGEIPKQDPVEKIYINLAEDTDSEYYLKFGRRTLPTFNSFQVALDLNQDKRLSSGGVISVAKDMMVNFGYTQDEMEKSFDDMIRRQVIGEPSVLKIMPLLVEAKIIGSEFRPSLAPKKVSEVKEDEDKEGGGVVELEGNFEPWVPERIDYLHDYR